MRSLNVINETRRPFAFEYLLYSFAFIYFKHSCLTWFARRKAFQFVYLYLNVIIYNISLKSLFEAHSDKLCLMRAAAAEVCGA